VSIFITSTGTEIGKTYITSGLLTWDSAHEQRFSASKPIISGWPDDPEKIQTTDTALLLKSQGLPLTPAAIDDCSPWRFSCPLTPDQAAQNAGRPIDTAALVRFCQQRILKARAQGQIHLIEGVGGVMSPIAGIFTNLEWLCALQCPCILVVGTYLGTLSHTLTALQVLGAHNISVCAVCVNDSAGDLLLAKKTSDYLQSLLPDLCILPFCDIASLATRAIAYS